LKGYSDALLKSYSKALLELIEDKELEGVITSLHFISQTLKVVEISDIVFNPVLKKIRKIEIINLLLKLSGNENKNLNSFIKIVVENRREEMLKDLWRIFESLALNREKIIKATILYALPLDEEIISKVKNAIEQLMKKPVRIEKKQDKSLIGGLEIKMEDMVLDLSLKGQLNSVTKQLIAEKR